MAKIEVTDRDKVMLTNLSKILKNAKYEVNGEELLITSQTFSYVGQLYKKVEEALEEPQKVQAKPEQKPKSKPKTTRGRKPKEKKDGDQ